TRLNPLLSGRFGCIDRAFVIPAGCPRECFPRSEPDSCWPGEIARRAAYPHHNVDNRVDGGARRCEQRCGQPCGQRCSCTSVATLHDELTSPPHHSRMTSGRGASLSSPRPRWVLLGVRSELPVHLVLRKRSGALMFEAPRTREDQLLPAPAPA